MTRQLMNYIRGAGQILDLSGSYTQKVISDIRNSHAHRPSDAQLLRKDMNTVGNDLFKVVQHFGSGMNDEQWKRP